MRERAALAVGAFSLFVEFARLIVVKCAVPAGRALTLRIKFAEG